MDLGLVEGITIIVALGAALALLVWGMARAFVARSFWCPFGQQNTAFSPETAVTCDTRCLRLPTWPSVRTHAGAA